MADKKQAPHFLFGFTAFTSKALSDTEPVMMSPTSILLKNPFWSESNSPKPNPSKDPRNGCLKFDTEGVGLGIIDSLTEDLGNPREKLIVAKRPENSRLVLFGSQLKIQIPTPHNSFAVDSPKSPMEFGIKTRNSQLGLVSPSNCGVKCSNLGPDTPGSISAAEMELSEDYTCVISRGGPVTKTTRIFGNCVVDSCFEDAPSGGGGGGSSPFARIDESMVSVSPDGPTGYPSESFLSFCHTCRKNLDHGTDIYMFRGEKAFCSDECRYEGMMMEENHGAPGVEES